MKKLIFIILATTSIFCFSQENKVYRIYLKDGSIKDIIKPVKGIDVVTCETSDGLNSLAFKNSEFYTIRLISNQKESYTSAKYSYCELVGIDTRKLFSIKQNLSVRVDYGDSSNNFDSDSGFIIDEKTGKAIVFTSMVEALNFMGQSGWEFVQAYTLSEPTGGAVYRWLLKRAIK